MVKLFRSSAALASLALSMSTINMASAEELCSIAPLSYGKAKTEYPDLAAAITTVEDYSIAAWYTDRMSAAEQATMLERLVTECSEDTRLTIVVYGIPNKDCAGGHSTEGSVTNTADYEEFLSGLTTSIGDRNVLYVVEPDAVGLLSEADGCGESAGYLDNLKVAIKALSANPNAVLYMDVGYWTLLSETQLPKVASVMSELSQAGNLRGITLNTSNYRTTKQMTELCTDFQTAVGSTNMTCIIDTSRNYLEPLNTEWCNVMEAGIGHPPTSETNIPNVDYFMWIKPPGESDGVCSTGTVNGTIAGVFFDLAFQHLWNQGYFVGELGMDEVKMSGATSPQTPSKPTYPTDSDPEDENPPKTTKPTYPTTDSDPEDDNPSPSDPDYDNKPETRPKTDPSTSGARSNTSNCKAKRRLRKF